MSLMDQLDKISQYAGFNMGIDNDAVLVVIAGGGDLPFISAWDRTGYRPYKIIHDDDYEPISREVFMRLVVEKNPLI